MAIENTNSTVKDINRDLNESKNNAVDYARQAAGEVTDKAKKMAGKVGGQTDSVLCSVGDSMSSLANTIRENAPRDGRVAGAAQTVAKGLEASGEYLAHHGVQDIAKDTTDIIRKHPMASLCVGVGVGVLLGSALSRSSNR